MAKDIISMQDANGNRFYPETISDAVRRTKDGTTVEDVILNLENRLSAIENPVRQFLEFTFLNGWENSSSGTNDLIIWKDPWGYVHMAGSIYNGTEGHILDLPEGYRPERVYGGFVRNASEGTTDAHLLINPDGTMHLSSEKPLTNVYNINVYYHCA